jgi:large subunit ribosomal protein L24
MSKWIQKGDKVLIIAGNDKGKIGEVLSRVKEETYKQRVCKVAGARKVVKDLIGRRDRVIVQGINIRKKHMKRSEGGAGGIVPMEKPIDISNVVLCNAEGKPIRLKVRISDGAKELYYKEGDQEIVHRQIRKNA